MSGETLKPMGVGEPVELTTTAKRMLDASDITDQDLGYSANNFAVVGTIGSYDPSTGSGESEVWLDILVTPQFAEPIHLRIEGDLTLANINSSQVDNLRMFEYSSTSLATTKAELREFDADLITSGDPATMVNTTPLIRFTQEAAVDYTAGVKVNRTYVIPNTATTDRHFKILYAGGNGGANPVSLAGVLIFEQWKVV